MEDNNKKKTTIYKQVRRTLVICLSVLQVIMFIASIAIVFRLSISASMRHASDLATSSMVIMRRYQSITSLVEYWYDNRNEMNLIYDSDMLNQTEARFRQIHPELITLNDVTDEDFGRMSSDEQQMFAELCYGRLCETFEGLKRSFSPWFLFSFYIVDDKIYYLATGIKGNEKRLSQGGDVYELGEVTNYAPGIWPGLDEMRNGEYREEGYYVDFDFSTSSAMATKKVCDIGDNIVVVGVTESFEYLLMEGLLPAVSMIIVNSIILLAVWLWVMNIIKTKIVNPISREEHAILGYMKDKDSARTVSELALIRPGNELETLSDSFSSMVQELDRYVEDIQKITAEKERISAELDLARQIQANMLPQVFPPYPDRTEFELSASMQPAKEVGGDFYDFFFTDDDHIMLVIGDVAGKGIPAALFMASAKNAIKNIAKFGGRPAEILGRANDALCEGNEDSMFVTVWIAEIDLKSGHVISCNAGHEYPLIRRAGALYEENLEKHDFALGVMEDKSFKEKEWDLKPGDSVFVYSDGVPEAQNINDEFFGIDRALQVLNEDPDGSADEIVNKVKTSVTEFEAGRDKFDDTTMLCFKYLGDNRI